MVNSLNPTLSTNLNLEGPVRQPDVGGALAGLFNQFAGAYADSQQTRQPTAKELENAALRPLVQRMEELRGMNLSPQQYQREINNAVRPFLAEYPEYAGEISSITGDFYGVDPSRSFQSDVLGMQQEWFTTDPKGQQALLLAQTYDETGQLDEAATAREAQRLWIEDINMQAEISRTADRTARYEGNTAELNAFTEQELQRLYLPSWTNRTYSTLNKVIETELRNASTPSEQGEALSTLQALKNETIQIYRREALQAGLSMDKVNELLPEAIRPIDDLIAQAQGSAESYTTALTAYQKALELDGLSLMVDNFGRWGAVPEFREQIAGHIALSAYTASNFEESFAIWDQQVSDERTSPFSLFPQFEVGAAAAEQGEAMLDPEKVESLAAGIEGGHITPQAALRTSIGVISTADINTEAGLDSITTEIGNIMAVSMATDQRFGYDVVSTLFGNESLRRLTTAINSDVPGSVELRSAVTALFGSQIARNGQVLHNLGYTLGWTEQGVAYLADASGKEVPLVRNPGRTDLDTAQEIVRVVNRMGSVLARNEGLKEDVTKGLGITLGAEPDIEELQQYLDNQARQGGKADPNNTRYSRKNAPTNTTEQVSSLVSETAARHGIDEKLFRGLISTESSWNPNAESGAGAYGLTQLMPKTAEALGVNPRNVAQNLDGGARYLRQMLDKYDDPVLALRAYNWGPGNMDAWLRTGKGVNGQAMPQETIDYPAKVLNADGPEYMNFAYADQYYTPRGVPSNIVVNQDMNPLLTSMEGASSMVAEYAVDHMDYILNGPFQQLQELFGSPVTINDGIARAGTSRESQTPGSQHFHGNALDLSTAGMSDEEKLRLFESALAAGFTGFGFGNNILHVDIGPTRSWAYGNTSYGGLPIAELQNMVASGAGPRLRVASSNRASVANLGEDRDVGDWKPDFDPGEGNPSNYVSIREQAVASSPRPQERPVTDGSEGARGKPSASQKATQKLTEQSKAVLKKLGVEESSIAGVFGSEEEVRQAVDNGQIEEGSIVEVGGVIMVAQ